MRVIGRVLGGLVAGLVLAACGSGDSAFKATSRKEIEHGCRQKAKAVEAGNQERLAQACPCIADGFVEAFDGPLLEGSRPPTEAELVRMNEITAGCSVPHKRAAG